MKIAISSEPRLLHIIRGVIRWQAEASGFLPADVEGLTLAIDEAVANVIRHTYRNRRDRLVELEVQAFPDRLVFILSDFGPKVREEMICPRRLEDVRPGGLGTFFINSFMDEICYDGECAKGNRLRMVKYLRKAFGNEGPSQKRG
jgi:anti-sigma regulatory factor (Ser/Thr protein kinase)